MIGRQPGATFPDRNTMVLERCFEYSLERLWQAISDTAQLDQWFMKTEMDAREGGRFRFEGGWEGKIGVWEAGSRIRYDADEGGSSCFELEEEVGGESPSTRLRIRDRLPEDFALDAPPDDAGALLKMMVAQPGGPGTHWPGVVAGWHGFFDALEAHLSETPFEDRYPELCATYSKLIQARFVASDGI